MERLIDLARTKCENKESSEQREAEPQETQKVRYKPGSHFSGVGGTLMSTEALQSSGGGYDGRAINAEDRATAAT